MKMSILTAAVLLMALATGCDELHGPFRETPVGPDDSTGKVTRNILLEDFTGQKCGNCPAATDIAKSLISSYGEDRVIMIAVHAGMYALPDPPEYAVDYRTAEGTQINNTFKINSYPSGMVSREKRNGFYGIDKGDWATVTSAKLDDEPLVDIKLKKSYDTVSGTLTIDADVKYLADGTADYQIVGTLTESHVIGDQIDYSKTPSHVEGYEFNHVMRASMNGVWGEQLSAAPVTKGTTISKRLTYTIPQASGWKPENMDAIVYVHKHNTTKEVLQVEHVKVK